MHVHIFTCNRMLYVLYSTKKPAAGENFLVYYLTKLIPYPPRGRGGVSKKLGNITLEPGKTRKYSPMQHHSLKTLTAIHFLITQNPRLKLPRSSSRVTPSRCRSQKSIILRRRREGEGEGHCFFFTTGRKKRFAQ